MVPSGNIAQKRSVLHVYSHCGIGILCTEGRHTLARLRPDVQEIAPAVLA